MSALATTIPVPCGAFMPVFVIGELFSFIVLFLEMLLFPASFINFNHIFIPSSDIHICKILTGFASDFVWGGIGAQIATQSPGTILT